MRLAFNGAKFVAALGGAASWPLAARAQQGNRVRRIGMLISGDENDPEPKRRGFVVKGYTPEPPSSRKHGLLSQWPWAASATFPDASRP